MYVQKSFNDYREGFIPSEKVHVLIQTVARKITEIQSNLFFRPRGRESLTSTSYVHFNRGAIHYSLSVL